MSLFSVMNVANKALSASQLAMDVASQNIANAGVQGYSRKRVNMTADYHKNPAFGQVGFGVSVLNITRIRNEYIDGQIRRQSHELGKQAAIDYTLEDRKSVV